MYYTLEQKREKNNILKILNLLTLTQKGEDYQSANSSL